ncbi:MAG: hypothetical protein A3J51_00045 [Omnitrophica WOR_2 bacterium RIFCSPHIGHO2_02_FULL_45_21]|nr:MAG: hypothetical protein A3J51_00045 [Omnitrophica WOR_2 bacterium RIFCSPHIGHO2_02_FULL_45_21]
MKRKSFTLIEILVGLIIISILASLSIASYRKTIEINNERICNENLKVLQKAIDIYTLENDSLPTTLAELTPGQIYLAHSQVAGEAKENHFTAALRNLLEIKPAMAQQPPLARYYASNRNIFRCPATTAAAPAPGSCSVNTTSVFTCSSYSFDLTGATFDSTTKRLKKGNITALVSDSSSRHRKGTALVMLGITPGGTVGKVSTGNIVIPDSPDQSQGS